MATVTIGSDSAEIPDEAVERLKAQVGRFPRFKGNVALWVREWVEGTLVALSRTDAEEQANEAHQEAASDIKALFKKK